MPMPPTAQLDMMIAVTDTDLKDVTNHILDGCEDGTHLHYFVINLDVLSGAEFYGTLTLMNCITNYLIHKNN